MYREIPGLRRQTPAPRSLHGEPPPVTWRVSWQGWSSFRSRLRPLVVEGRQYFFKSQARLRFEKVCRVKALYDGQALLNIWYSKFLCQAPDVVDIGAALDAPYAHRAAFHRKHVLRLRYEDT